LAAPSAIAQGKAIERHALVIGANDGGAGRVKLRYAATDARAVARVLTALGGVEARHLTVLEEPTRAQLDQAIRALAHELAARRSAAQRLELVVYYSGHSDEGGLLPSGERLSWSELRKMLGELPADVRIAILDSCASGALLRAKGGVMRAPFLQDASTQVSGHAYLTSSSADEVAQESDRLQASYFTHHLVSGLRGAADSNGDHRVTLSEAYQYAFHRTLQRTEQTNRGPQHPNYDFDLAGSGDVVITDLRAVAAVLALEPPLSGRLWVRDAAGRLVAEIDKAPGQGLEIGLESGGYRLALQVGRNVYAAVVELATGTRQAVSMALFAPQPLETTRARGGTDVPQWAEPDSERPPWARPPDRPSPRDVPPPRDDLDADHWEPPPPAAPVIVVVPAPPPPAPPPPVAEIPFTGEPDPGARAVPVAVELLPGLGIPTSPFSACPTLAVAALGAIHACNRGIAVGGAFHVATGSVQGMQLAGVVAVAKDLRGIQAATVNVARSEMRGAQLGALNVAGKVWGVQMGIVNVADEIVSGDAIGLVNVIGNGYRHLEVWTSDVAAVHVGYKFGSRFTYLLGGIGLGQADDASKWSLGLGWGVHVPLGQRLYTDVDVMLHLPWQDESLQTNPDTAPSVLLQPRATLGFALGKSFAVFAGASLNQALGGGAPTWQRHRALWLRNEMHPPMAPRRTAQPGVFAGVRF
jgi:hypothetical protein